MKNNINEKQLQWLNEIISDRDVIYMGIHGSHLYGLNTPNSDLDIKAIYLPSRKDLVLGIKNNIQRKNKELNIEAELISIQSFLCSCEKCDTNCFDMLHSTDEMNIISSDLWKSIKNIRADIYAKDMKGIICYIKTHSMKYSAKISRLQELYELKRLAQELQFRNITEFEGLVDITKLQYTKFINQDGARYIEVLGKKYISSIKQEPFKNILDGEIKRYGKRVTDANEDSVDFKSLSHAYRVLSEIQDLIDNQNINFPLVDADYIKQIKTGKVKKEDVFLEMDKKYDRVMISLKNSNFKETPNIQNMIELVQNHYFKGN